MSRDRMRIVSVHAYTTPSPAADADPYAASGNHWIAGHVANPLSVHPEYRATRGSWGMGRIGTLTVRVETAGGVVGTGSAGIVGVPGCWIVENELARFVEGRSVADVELISDILLRATLYYGRRGLVMHAVSAVDLAVWDALGRCREEPVWNLIGGRVHDELPLYCTGPRPDLAARMGFVGGKLPLEYAPAEGEEGLLANIDRVRRFREAVPDEFLLMLDCWMSLDPVYAARLAAGCAPYGVYWIEEPLPPDDYIAMARLRRAFPTGTLLATGEHEAGVAGFRHLLESECCDVVQPDLGWCGGMTVALKVAALAEAHRIPLVPHGLSPYHIHFAVSRSNIPYLEFLVPAPSFDESTRDFDAYLPPSMRPRNGRIGVDDSPGFGGTPQLDGLVRPFTH